MTQTLDPRRARPVAPPPSAPGAPSTPSAPARSAPPVRAALTVSCTAVLACLHGPLAHAADPMQRVLEDVPVSRHQLFVAQTPIAVRDGTVYMATIEPGASGRDSPGTGDLRTVVRRGVPDGAGNWSWTATVIEDRSVADAWHTPPSVGLDERGFVHVAYNMHNLPWQYVVSRAPGDIDDFEFRGQQVSQAELDLYRLENRTGFPDLGTAAIPGNQITYPAFTNDRSGRLHVSYRYAARPGLRWAKRTLSTGLARYDANAGTWTSLGARPDIAPSDHDGSVGEVPRAIASAQGWTSYLPRVTFGPDDAPTVSLMWRDGNPGSKTSRPCAVRGGADGADFTALDGSPVSAPARPEDCPAVSSADSGAQFHSIGDAAADSAGRHHLLLSPDGGGREIHAWIDGGWTATSVPSGAVEIFFDAADNLWAVGTGPTLHVRRAGADGWDEVGSGGGTRGCFPHAELDDDGVTAFVFTLGCDEATATVTRLDLQALLGETIVAVGGGGAPPGPAPATDELQAQAAPETAPPSADGVRDDGVAYADAAEVEAELVEDTAAEMAYEADAEAASQPALPELAGAGPAAGADGLPLVLPRLEWRPLTLPEASVGLTAAAVFAELPADDYGTEWVLYGYDPLEERYFVPGIDEPMRAGRRYWAIQALEDAVVVELARTPPVWE